MDTRQRETKAIEWRDPVCGMTVGPGAQRADGYPGFGFCSEPCRRTFLAHPERHGGGLGEHHAAVDAGTAPAAVPSRAVAAAGHRTDLLEVDADSDPDTAQAESER